jgi:N6-adenosine-specific RNA methylase IME4
MIPATILSGISALDAEAAEISENLVRQELTATQKSLQYSRLMEIAETKFRMKAGRPTDDSEENSPHFERKPGDEKRSNSAVAVANETGRSASAIERDMRRTRNISNISSVIGTSLDAGTELDALASLPEDKQRELIEKAKAGEKVSARTELKKHQRAEKERTLGEKQRDLPTALNTGAWIKSTYNTALIVGKAGEHLVCADALMNGCNSYLSAQGSLYDVVLEKDGKLYKVQVKSSQEAKNVNSKGRNERIAYSFNVRRRGTEGNGIPLRDKDADLIALVAMDTLQIAYIPLSDCPMTVQLNRHDNPTDAHGNPTLTIADYPLQEAIIKLEAHNAYRELKNIFPAFPNEKFSVLLCDIPWSFKSYSEKGMDRSADNHYPTVSTDVLCAVGPYIPADDDSVIFMWATSPMLEDALQVMKSWGFGYKSSMVWVKDRMGTGYWFRNQHELLLIGTRGNVIAPAPGSQFPSVITAPVGKHSQKPEEFYRVVENYFPTVSKIELFARNGRENWYSYGNEAPIDEDSWDDAKVEEFEPDAALDFDDIFGDD